MDQELIWFLDRYSHFRGNLYVAGWAFHPQGDVTAVAIQLPSGALVRTSGYGDPSPDVAAQYGDRARNCRFSFEVSIPDPEEARNATLAFCLNGEADAKILRAPTSQLPDPYHQLYARFVAMVSDFEAPTVVEMGSRARSGNIYSGWISTPAKYVGFDVRDGPNVDVVGDAHQLSRSFAHSSVDAVFAISTLEHLAMPWKVVLELNTILKQSGIVFLATHQTWPIHEAPWDFWRFSSHSWPVLFNKATGFEVLDVAMGEQASVVADFLPPPTSGLDFEPAFLGSAVIARKIGPTSLRWDVDLELITTESYPG